jgi:hypothetical protein
MARAEPTEPVARPRADRQLRPYRGPGMVAGEPVHPAELLAGPRKGSCLDVGLHGGLLPLSHIAIVINAGCPADGASRFRWNCAGRRRLDAASDGHHRSATRRRLYASPAMPPLPTPLRLGRGAGLAHAHRPPASDSAGPATSRRNAKRGSRHRTNGSLGAGAEDRHGATTLVALLGAGTVGLTGSDPTDVGSQPRSERTAAHHTAR